MAEVAATIRSKFAQKAAASVSAPPPASTPPDTSVAAVRKIPRTLRASDVLGAPKRQTLS